jgi:hypothetical protein
MELLKRQCSEEYRGVFGTEEQKEMDFEPVLMEFVYGFLEEKNNNEVPPIDMTFMSGFSGSYHLAAKKNLRCFPSCCEQGHLERSFCGTNIEISVAMHQSLDVGKFALIGEFTTTERGASLSFGQDVDEYRGNASFLKGSFSRYTTNTPNIAVFTIRPPRKWQLTARSCKVKMYILVVYLVVDKRVQSVLSSPTFEVKCRKQERKLRANSSSTTTSTTSTFSSEISKENCIQAEEKMMTRMTMATHEQPSSSPDTEDDDDDEEEKCTESNEDLENQYQDDSHSHHFHDPTFGDDIVRFLEFSDHIEQ